LLILELDLSAEEKPMKNSVISALLLTVAIPVAAVAQTTTTQQPLVQTEEPSAPAQDTAPDDGTAPAEAPANPQADTTQEPAPTDSATTPPQEPADSETATDDEDGAPRLAGEDAVEGPFVTVPLTGAWRVSDLEGKNVEDANGDNIGDITDVLVNERGEVIAVLVGVGGFLGIGQKNVAVSMSALEFGPGKTEGLPTEEEVQAEQQQAQEQAMNLPATSPTTGTGGVAVPPAPAPAAVEPATPVVGQDNLPDRIVLNVTREELEAAPAYEDVQEGNVPEGVVETPNADAEPAADQ
jgi:hypothetical protein